MPIKNAHFVFINYRRSDSLATANHLATEISHAFGAESVFIDETGIDPLERWPKSLSNAVGKAAIVLALLGKGWHLAQNKDSGMRRLDDPEDWVRKEIAAALKRNVLLPVLVDGLSEIPTKALDDLDDIADMAKVEAVKLRSGHDWGADRELLFEILEKHGLKRLSRREEQKSPSEIIEAFLNQAKKEKQTSSNRLFQTLNRLRSKKDDIQEAGAIGGAMDENVHGRNGNTTTPLGYIFLAQFILNDITFQRNSSSAQNAPPHGMWSTLNTTKQLCRPPALNLDCIYGGIQARPEIYYQDNLLLVSGDDFQRVSHSNSASYPLMADYRSDDNRVLSQLHLSMHYFHNAVVKYMQSTNEYESDLFADAQQQVRWHYQWVVVNDFLVRMVGEDLVEDILANGCRLIPDSDFASIPIEFSVGAYRFGHALLKTRLAYNEQHASLHLFGPDLGSRFSANSVGAIDWKNFFGPGSMVASPVDIRLPTDLLALPFIASSDVCSLATRNILRGQVAGLPSGQNVRAIISELCGKPLPEPDLGASGLPDSLIRNTPLWLYVLAEGQLSNGQKLGPVGGRIIAEVLIRALECDGESYLSDPDWSPSLDDKPWDMLALLEFGGYGV